MLPQLIQNRREDIQALCERFGVIRLELFGSAATEHFDPQTSDLDFLVDFGNQDLGPWLKQYFEFRDALAELFNRPVDLVMNKKFDNPYFQQDLDATRTPLYAA